MKASGRLLVADVLPGIVDEVEERAADANARHPGIVPELSVFGTAAIVVVAWAVRQVRFVLCRSAHRDAAARDAGPLLGSGRGEGRSGRAGLNAGRARPKSSVEL